MASTEERWGKKGQAAVREIGTKVGRALGEPSDLCGKGCRGGPSSVKESVSERAGRKKGLTKLGRGGGVMARNGR